MEVIIKNLQKKIPINPTRIKRAVLKTLSLRAAKKSGQITVCFFDDKEMRELNLFYLGQDSPTDVIAFDESANRSEIIADIAVSTGAALGNARIFKTTPTYELYLYIIHGVLHILGFDDHTQAQRKVMEKKASDILSKLNIKSK